MNLSLFEQIQQTASDVLQVPPRSISLQTSAAEVDRWDSLNHLKIVLALEERFQVRFTPVEITSMLRICDMVLMVSDKVANRAPHEG